MSPDPNIQEIKAPIDHSPTGLNVPSIRNVFTNIDTPIVKTGIIGSSSNMVNAILGAGLIGVPFAIKESGIVVGVVLLIIVGIFIEKSLRMLIELATYHPKLKNLGVLTFEDLIKIPYGKVGKNFILLSMFILAYGSGVAAHIIVKDNVPEIFGMGDSFAARELIMVATSLCIMFPLSMMRDISELALTSFLSVAAGVILVTIICVHAPVSESVGNAGGFGQVLKEHWINSGVFIGLGVLSTAMTCHDSCFLVSGTLENHTALRWSTVTGISVILSTGLSLLFGVVCYLCFFEDTQGDVLQNFGQGMLVNTARGLLSLTMFLTYPMDALVARHVIGRFFFDGSMDNHSVDFDGEILPEKKIFFGLVGRRELVTVGLWLACLTPALMIDDLGPVLSLTGALGAASIAYIAPGLVFLGVNGDDFLAWTGEALQNKQHKYSHNGGGDEQLLDGGDISAMNESPLETTYYPLAIKPWWWWPLGMPIWVAIASVGAKGSNDFLLNLEMEVGRSLESGDSEEVARPRKVDYCFSIVFIVFGVIVAVAGVASNIYVQVNNIVFAQ